MAPNLLQRVFCNLAEFHLATLKFGQPERDSIPFDSGIILQWDSNPDKLRQKATQLVAMNKTYVLEVRYIDESWKCSLHISGQFKQLCLIKKT